MSKQTGLDFLSHAGGFASFTDADDGLHPDENARVTDDSLSETHYFSFNVPEENITGYSTLWIHPNLNVATGGVMAWQGIKPHTLTAEIYDMRAYMNTRFIPADLHEYKMSNGYHVRCIKPMAQHLVAYNDPFRKNSFEIEHTAIMPPAMLNPRGHFDQAMRIRGIVTLRGKTYDVDSFSVRDRSWGKPRSEDIAPVPPLAWSTGVFDADFAFGVTCFDDPVRNPDWSGAFALPQSETLKGGWIFDKGRLLSIQSVSKQTQRNPRTLYPEVIEMDLVDVEGTRYEVRGTIVAACNWPAWPNLALPMAMARWECRGQVGYGDVQEAQWADYVRHCMKY